MILLTIIQWVPVVFALVVLVIHWRRTRSIRNRQTIDIRMVVTREHQKRLDRLLVVTGTKTYRDLYAAQVDMSEWMIRHLDQGYVIGAVDPEGRTYAQLDMSKHFPNLAKTCSSDPDHSD